MTENKTYNEKLELAIDNIETKPEHSGLVELSSGVVLKFKSVPILRIQAVLDQFPYPPVPLIYNEDKGRDERWAGSEEYTQMKADVDGQRIMALMDAVLVIGTEVHSVPDGFSKHEDDDWIESIELGHIKVNTSTPLARYHSWCKYVAIVSQDDVAKVVEQFGVQTGTSEVLVAEQLQNNFQDN